MKKEYESEQNQDACYLDMPKGLHVPNYKQEFVRAPKSLYPKKASNEGKSVSHEEVMKMLK